MRLLQILLFEENCLYSMLVKNGDETTAGTLSSYKCQGFKCQSPDDCMIDDTSIVGIGALGRWKPFWTASIRRWRTDCWTHVQHCSSDEQFEHDHVWFSWFAQRERERETCIKRAHSHEHVDPFKKGTVFMVQYGNNIWIRTYTNILSRSNWTSSLYTEVTVCHYLLKWQRMNLNGKSFAAHRNYLYMTRALNPSAIPQQCLAEPHPTVFPFEVYIYVYNKVQFHITKKSEEYDETRQAIRPVLDMLLIFHAQAVQQWYVALDLWQAARAHTLRQFLCRWWPKSLPMGFFLIELLNSSIISNINMRWNIFDIP